MLFASSYICYYVVRSIIAKHNASNYMHQPAPAIFSFDFDLKKKKKKSSPSGFEPAALCLEVHRLIHSAIWSSLFKQEKLLNINICH